MYCPKETQESSENLKFFSDKFRPASGHLTSRIGLTYLVSFFKYFRGLWHLQNTFEKLLLKKQSIWVPIPPIYQQKQRHLHLSLMKWGFF